MGAPRRRRRERLRAALRRRPGQEEDRRSAQEARRRRPTSSCSRRTRTARARRSPGTCSRCSSRRCRSAGWSSTRSRATRSAARSSETRDIDERLVDAQETRRILDRLYGYEVSPVLWKKVMRGLSAGRVQSVATRLVVERERERMAFVAARRSGTSRRRFDAGPLRGAALPSLDGTRSRRAATSAATGELRDAALVRLDEEQRAASPSGCSGVRSPSARSRASRTAAARAAPFMTSTLQQEASRKLRFTAQTTMRVAQRLYEDGYITYMRTDSTTLSESALAAARDAGAASSTARTTCRDKPRRYERKVKNAQEAHEAIRPAGDTFRRRSEVAGELGARRAGALRADLAPHDRLADGGRDGRDGLGADRRHDRRRTRSPSSRRRAP